MTKRMLIDALHPEETRVIIADDNKILDFDFVSVAKKQLKGNIYLAKITRVEPSLQAAFVEYGGNKQGFLPFSEIHPDYYQIPVSDRKRLMEEAEREDPQESEPEDTASASDNSEGAMEAAGEQDDAAYNEDTLPQADDATEHPAYLVEGAIDVSASSEEIEQSELPEQPQDSETVYVGGESADAPSEQQQYAENNDAKPSEAANEEVETLPNEEEEIHPRKKLFSRRYKIQEVIRRGQVVLVQVIKEERGNKGVSLTTYLSLAGRYCVLMPNSPKDGGISRKIMSPEDRKRLKAITTELRLANAMSVIIRTAGMDRTRAEIKRDYDYLVKVWNSIRENTLQSNAPALIYEESNLIKRAIRDQYTNDIDELIVEGDDGYQAARDFMKLLLPSHAAKIKHYEDATPLFYAYNLEEQLLSMHDPVVKLRSGGYIVINPTEALISIDVNSGRSTGERNIEETATKTNLEAAAEVARQMRLRDLAGLIVIDFIDMLESRNRRAVERALKESLKADRAKIQIGRISPFGLLEMSRQRLRPSISETNMVQCAHCMGRGYIRSNESMSIQIIRALEKEASTGNWGTLRLVAAQEVAIHLLNTKRDILRVIEERHGISILVTVNPSLTTSEFNLEKMRKSSQSERGDQRRGRRGERSRQQVETDLSIMEEVAAEAAEEPIEGGDELLFPEAAEQQQSPSGDGRRGRGRRRRRGRRGGGNDRFPSSSDRAENVESMEGTPASEETVSPGADAAGDDKVMPLNRKRERGGRGRRRWRDRNDREGQGEQRVIESSPAEASVAVSEPARQPYREPAREPVIVAQTIPVRAVEQPAPRVESTPREPGKPAKKGWWQKMIELDD